MYQAVDWFVIIAELRKRGISRTKLAKKLGVSTSTVSAWFYCLAAPLIITSRLDARSEQDASGC